MTAGPFVDGPLLRARFVDRPNRFLVRCRLDGGQRVTAFLPNPGRMDELLFPEVELTLVPAPAGGNRRTRWTCVAVEREGETLFLHTHRTNAVARHLLESGRVPGLRGWRIAASEVAAGHSRFDFLLRRGSRRLWLEVKSCTLFGNGVAMFPDAVTERGRRHLLELAAMPRGHGERPAVMFVVHTPSARWFLPDYHTDLAFSRTLLEVRRQVRILPVAVGWNADLTLREETRLLDIPWGHLRREAVDRGAYLLLLRLARRRRLRVGGLGEITFAAGWHIYVGSAMANLTARLERHRRRRKRFHWHVDYLRDAATEVAALPVRSSSRRECELAAGAGALFPAAVAGFGCSDCGCGSHLFAAGGDPRDRRDFHEWLQSHRMSHPPGPSPGGLARRGRLP